MTTINGYGLSELCGRLAASLDRSTASHDRRSQRALLLCAAELACTPGQAANAVRLVLELACRNVRFSRDVDGHERLSRVADALSHVARRASKAARDPAFQRLFTDLCSTVSSTRPKQLPAAGRSAQTELELVVFGHIAGPLHAVPEGEWEDACLLAGDAKQPVLLHEVRLFGLLLRRREHLPDALRVLAFVLAAKPSRQSAPAIDFSPVSTVLDVENEVLRHRSGHVAWLAWFAFVHTCMPRWSPGEMRYAAASLRLFARTFKRSNASDTGSLLLHTVSTVCGGLVVVTATSGRTASSSGPATDLDHFVRVLATADRRQRNREHDYLSEGP